MRQHAGLGTAGRARGEEEPAGIITVNRRDSRTTAYCFGGNCFDRRPEIRSPEGQDRLQFGAFCLADCGMIREGCIADHQLRA